MRDYEAVLKQARTCANRKYCDIGGNCEYYDLDVCCQGGEKDILKDAADAIEELRRNLKDCRNELCLKCGEYKQRHLGACDGCRWKEPIE